jgi:hypothetical protein
MAQTTVNAQNATFTLARTGSARLKNIRITQRAGAAARLFLQLFDLAAPTVGTTVPTMVIPIPAGNTQSDGEASETRFSSNRGGIIFSTAISFAATTTATGLTAPTAGQEPEVSVDWEPNA